MAIGSSGLNLGDVAFGLVAETAGLDRALDKLRIFGDLVNKTAKSSEDGARATEAAFVRQEKAIAAAFQKVQSLNQAIRQSGAPVELITRNTSTFRSLTSALTEGEVSSQRFARAQQQITARFNETTRALREYKEQQAQLNALQARITTVHRTGIAAGIPGIEGTVSGAQTSVGSIQGMFSTGNTKGANTAIIGLGKSLDATELKIAKANSTASKWATVMRDLERSAILAVGPLSGIGARMAVLAALFESTTIKNALFVAGLAGSVISLGLLAVAAVKATMQFQQWNAMMISASGALVLVGDDLKFVIEQSNKYGQAIEGTIPAYTKFAASARLSGLAIEDQRKTFTAFVTAGAALHWTVEQTGNAFLALEQVMSKGTVQTEEIKKQLGNVLPGAFELAAASVGKTTSEFTRMLKAGQLLSTDFLPKFSAMVEAVYRGGAEKGRLSLVADLNRLHNSLLLMFKAFDDTIHASTVFQAAIQGLDAVIKAFTNNMDMLLRVSGAFFAGVVAFVAGGAILQLGAAFITLNRIMKESATVLAAITALFAPEAAILKTVLKLIGALGTGAAVFYLMESATDKAAAATKIYTRDLSETIDMLQKAGMVSEGTKKRLTEQAKEQLTVFEEGQKAAYKLFTSINQSPWAGTEQKEKAEAARDTFLQYGQAITQVKQALEALGKIKMVRDPSNDPVDKSLAAQERAQAKINELQEEYNTLIETGDKGQAAISRKVQAMEEALKKVKASAEVINKLTTDYFVVLQNVEIQHKKIADAKKLDEANKAIDRYLANHKQALNEVNKKYDEMREIIIASEGDLERLNAIERMRIIDLNKTLYELNPTLKALHETLVSIGDDGSKALVDMFNGVDGAMLNFFRNMILQIELMIVKLYVMKPLMESLFGGAYSPTIAGSGLFGSLLGFPSTTSGSSGATVANTITYQAHGGGAVGSGMQRSFVDPSIFNGAPRFHRGLAPDEFPTILQYGEEVLTKNQRAAASKGINMQVNIINNASDRVQTTAQSNSAGGLEIIIDQIESKIARNVTRGVGPVSSALTNTFGLNRATGALR